MQVPVTRAPPGLLHQAYPVATTPGPQDVATPFELKTISGPALAQNPGASAASATLLTVQSPAIVFHFPIVPDMDYYNGSGLYRSPETVGVTGSVAMEACLTPQEVSAWSGALLIGADPNTCGTEDDLVHAKELLRSWYQVATVNVDGYALQNGGVAGISTPLPVNLQQIDTPIRFHLKGFVYYYPGAHTGPNNYAAACPPEHCGNGNFELRSNPVKLVVLPTFMFQLKVLPQTIVYLPPGNNSFGSYTVTSTFSTTLSAGDTTEIDNSNANDQWNEDVNDSGASVDIAKIFSLGFSSTDDTRWDTKTTVKAGQSQEHDISVQTQVQTVMTAKVVSSSANVPGPGGAVANEPFWGDEVIVLVHPQFAVWNFYGKPTVQLLAASNSILPDDVPEQVANLDACANGAAPFAGGIAITAATGAQVVLTAADCRNLAVLDPFYGHGQAANVAARGTLFQPQVPYGVSPTTSMNGAPLDLKAISSLQTQVTNQSVQTYVATVEDIVATTQSTGLKIGANAPLPGLTLGLTGGFTLKQGSTTDTSQTMNLTFKNSSATVFRTDVAVEGSINDTVNRKTYQPQVAVYLDNLFGGLMAVDPGAPLVPCKPQPACAVVAPVGSTLRAR
ncbi:MAG TPA: hypothetical protein VGL58_00880 [Caulobacteraceae bacterium]